MATYFSGLVCSTIIIIFVTLFSTVIEVKTFPQRQLVSKNYTSLFSISTLDNGSKWIVPRFRFNHYENVTFCRNRQTIRMPVRSKMNIITIPCWTTYSGFQDGTNIMLYKGSPDTNLTPISSEHGGILEFVGDQGFRYNFTGDWSENNSSVLGRYTCFIANSSGENYVIAEYYRDDNGVDVYSRRQCEPNYHENNKGIFLCRVKGVENETDFEWSFLSEDNNEVIFPPRKRYPLRSKDGLVVEEIRVTLPYSNISKIGCRVKRSGSNETFQGFFPIEVQEFKIPIIRGNTTVELYDEPGINLTCSFEGAGSTVKWLQDGQEKLQGQSSLAWPTPIIGKTTLTGFSSPYNTTNYTCIVENAKGSSSKTFVVRKPLLQVAIIDQSADQLVYIYILAALTIVLLLALALEWRKRFELLGNVKNALKKLGRHSNSLEIQLDEDLTNWKFLGKGASGQVWRTQVKLPNTDETVYVVAKSIMWYPTLRRKAAKILFDDFINEITYHSKLFSKCDEDPRTRYIVRYLGFYAPDVLYFRVYLILDFCNLGQLESFLHQCRDDRFFNDINGKNKIYRYEQRLRQEQLRGDSCLGISHLMKFAEQIALAMEYLHFLKIVHRDLAARNALLKGNQDKSMDEVVAQLADLGLSRSVEHSSNYVMNQKLKTKPRNLPLLWYPPESIGFGADVEYTTKSDVWSFGVLLWEMFSLGKHPYEGYGLSGKVEADSLKKGLQNRKLKLKRTDLKKIPDQIWLLMQRCWQLCPEDRPDFLEIYQTLKAINLSYGLVATEEEPIHPEENQDASQTQADSPDQVQSSVEVNLDVNQERVFYNHSRNYSQHSLQPISSIQNQAANEINSHEGSQEIGLIELENIPGSNHSSTSDLNHVLPVENQVAVNSDEIMTRKNTFTVLCKNEYVSG